jgi:hypothetical protein
MKNMANMIVGLGADDWQWLPDLLLIKSIGTTSATTFSYTNNNGHTVTVTGSGFTFSGDAPTGGILTSIEVVDGAEAVLSITGASTSLKDFVDLLDIGDSFAGLGLVLDGDDTVTGSSESNSLGGYSAGDDIVNGAGADDFIQGDEGDDDLDGGDGWDGLSYIQTYYDTSLKKGIVLNAATGTVKDPWGDTDAFKNFENYWGTVNKDKIVGSENEEEFVGLRGADKFDGKGGRDQLDYSRDVDYGGKKGIKVELNVGEIRDGFGDTDRVKNVESIIGTQKNDNFLGGKGDDVFKGLGGKDKYNGGDGFDQIAFNHNEWNGGKNGVSVNVAKGKILDDGYGNSEKFKSIESFHGTNLDDEFVGSKKDDEFKGEEGNDTMTGGDGGDMFVFNPPPDNATNHDIITDFNEGEGDRIALWKQDGFPQLNETDGDLDPAQFVANEGGVPTSADQRIIYDTATGKLWLDADGNATTGDQILIVTLTNRPTITVDAFEVWV